MRVAVEVRPRRGTDEDDAEIEVEVEDGKAARRPRRVVPRRIHWYSLLCTMLDLCKRTVLMLPVLMVIGLASMYWYTFVFVFQLDRIQRGDTTLYADVWIGLFTVIAGLCLWSYFRCVFTSNAVVKNSPPPSFDVDGCRRCDRCSSLKPNRAHHCSVCGECSLKMDHHCPWVANCVGHMNHKYFILFVFYACVGCNLYIVGSFQGILRMATVLRHPDSLASSFLTLFSVISSFAFGLTLTGFVGFHFYLVMTNQTTLEYGYLGSDNPYNQGCRRNFELVFGRNKLYWFLPVNTLEITGYDFHSCANDMLLEEVVNDEV